MKEYCANSWPPSSTSPAALLRSHHRRTRRSRHPLLDLLEDPAFLAMMPDGTGLRPISTPQLFPWHETPFAHKAAPRAQFRHDAYGCRMRQAGHADDLGWIALGDLSVDPRAPIPITQAIRYALGL